MVGERPRFGARGWREGGVLGVTGASGGAVNAKSCGSGSGEGGRGGGRRVRREGCFGGAVSASVGGVQIGPDLGGAESARVGLPLLRHGWLLGLSSSRSMGGAHNNGSSVLAGRAGGASCMVSANGAGRAGTGMGIGCPITCGMTELEWE